MRKEGGKYAHLNDNLHVFIECNAPIDQAYERIGRAIAAVRPYFDPVSIAALLTVKYVPS